MFYAFIGFIAVGIVATATTVFAGIIALLQLGKIRLSLVKINI